MAIQFGDMIKEPASNKPTAGGTFNLSGTASSGFEKFDSQITSGNQVICSAKSNAGQMEFIGTYTNAATDTISVTTLRHSSTGSLIDFSGGDTVVLENVMDSAYLNRLELNAYNLENNGYSRVNNDSSTTQTLAASTDVKITTALTTIAYNPLSWWDATNKRFLPTRAGLYFVASSVQVSSVPSGVVIRSNIKKNGTAVLSGHVEPTLSYPLSMIGNLVALNGSTDYIELYCHNTHTSALDTTPGVNIYFSIVYLGP